MLNDTCKKIIEDAKVKNAAMRAEHTMDLVIESLHLVPNKSITIESRLNAALKQPLK